MGSNLQPPSPLGSGQGNLLPIVAKSNGAKKLPSVLLRNPIDDFKLGFGGNSGVFFYVNALYSYCKMLTEFPIVSL